MNRRSALAVLAVCLAAGCVKENRTSFQVHGFCTMPDDCSFGSTCSEQPLDVFVLDVARSPWMFVAVEVDNNLRVNGDSTGRLDTNDGVVKSYSVSYSAPEGIEIDGSDGGSLPSVQIQAGGKSVVGFDAITTRIGTQLQSQIPASTPEVPIYEEIVANVTLHGELNDGSDFETSEIRVPVKVCRYCIAVPTCEEGEFAVACPNVGQYPRGNVSCEAL